MLAIGTKPISCVFPGSCLNTSKICDCYFCLHNVIQVSFHNFFITRATPSRSDSAQMTL